MRSRLNPIKLLQARTEARAILYDAGHFDLDTAIEPLFLFAIEAGIPISLARDIIGACFRLDPDPEELGVS